MRFCVKFHACCTITRRSAYCGAQPNAPRSLSDAATAPLGDLNLVRAKIPPVLLAAQKAPYGPPADPSCAGLVAEVQQLDAALPPDLDAPSAAPR